MTKERKDYNLEQSRQMISMVNGLHELAKDKDYKVVLKSLSSYIIGMVTCSKSTDEEQKEQMQDIINDLKEYSGLWKKAK